MTTLSAARMNQHGLQFVIGSIRVERLPTSRLCRVLVQVQFQGKLEFIVYFFALKGLIAEFKSIQTQRQSRWQLIKLDGLLSLSPLLAHFTVYVE
jgi:hypothetical protein